MDARHADLLTDAVATAAQDVARRDRAAWIERVANAYEVARRAAERGGTARATAAWYTPVDVVQAVLDEALPTSAQPNRARPGQGGRPRPAPGQGGRPSRTTVVDPACGTGHFLAAAAERFGAAGVQGMDLDPMAVAIARVRLRTRFGGTAAHWRKAVRCGDALAAGAWAGRTFDAVVGNPPFLGQLSRRTARSAAEREALQRRFGGAVGRYADAASAFLLLAAELAPKGRVALVQPLSVLSAADAATVRTACERLLPLRAVRVVREDAFGAEVRTCVVVLASGAKGPVRAVAADGTKSDVPRHASAGGAWGAALAAARAIPAARMARTDGTLDGWMTATSDFRQHYYGLRGHVHEARGAKPSRAAPALVTVGAIDAAGLAWARRPVRIHGVDFAAPVVRTAELKAHRVLGPWVAARRVPKVLVATQTRAIEGWVDDRGTAVGSTPVITVVPRRSTDLWRVGAALLAPPVAAEAWWRHAGAAMSSTAIRVSASQLRQLPAPGGRTAWDRGARALRAWQRSGRSSERARFADAMCDAYGVAKGPARARLVAWWTAAVDPAR